MAVTNVLASIAIRDLAAAIQWYAALLGRPHDASPMEGLAEWSFDGGGWLQVFVDADRAGTSSITLVVDDIEATRRSLAAAGHDSEWTFDGPTTSGTVVRDPDGNRVVFARSNDPVINPSAAARMPTGRKE
ncbi:catechol 2,3-dioxygenase-like lactoylglutathione lyase family enzyme [Amorphus suaedae]